jgi:O-antigen/teichoic acid export membrane protein
MKDDESIRIAPRSRATGGRGAPSLMRNVLSNWTVLGSAVLYSLLITPTVVHSLDREAYGIWSFLNAFVAYSNLFYLGLGAALLRFGAQHYAARNRSALNRLVSVVITIYSGLGLLSLLAGIVAAPYVPELFSSTNGSWAVSATVIVLAARLGLMFVGSVFSGVLVAQGRMDLYNLITICGHLSRLVIVPFAVGTQNPMLALALSVGITGAAEVTAMAVVALRLDPSLKVRLVIPAAAELRLLYGFGVFAFLLQVADRLISYSDTIVIGITLGAGDVALYALPLQLAEYGRLVVRGLVSVMLPHLSALLATGQIARFRSSYIRTVRVTAFVAAFVAVNLVSLGPMFLRLWVGPTFAVNAAPVLVCLGIAGFVQAIAVQSQTPFWMALGKVRFASAVLLAEAVANVALSIVLARWIGIVGVALATAVPAVMVSGLFLTIHGARQVGVPLLDVLRRVVPVAGFVAVLIVAHLVMSLTIPAESYLVLGVRLALVTVVAAVVGWILMSDGERRAIRVTLERARRTGSGARDLLVEQEASSHLES